MRIIGNASGKAMLWVSLLGGVLLLCLYPGVVSAQAPWQAVLSLKGQEIEGAVDSAAVTIGAADVAEVRDAPPNPPPDYTADVVLWALDWSKKYLMDIRAIGPQTELWILELDPHGNVGSPFEERNATLSWDPDLLGVGAFELREGGDGQGAILVPDMKAETSYVFTGTGKSYYTVTWTWTPPPAAGIALSADSLDFGEVAIEDSSSLILRVYSVGADTLEVTALDPTGDYSAVPDTFLPALVAPGDSLDVTVTFRPSAEGPIPGTLAIYSNDPDTPDTTVVLSGIGYGIPDIGVDPGTLDFGDVAIDSSESLLLVVDNYDGTDTLWVDSLLVIGGDYAATDGLPALVEPGLRITLTVTFSPSVEGPISGTLRLWSNDSDESPLDVPLFGNGVGEPKMVLSTDALEFGVVEIDSSAVDSLWVYSVGTDTLVVDYISTPGGSDFSVSPYIPPDPSELLPPGDSLKVAVTFTPSVEGPIIGDMKIGGNDPDLMESPLVVSLNGEGFGVPRMALSDTLLDFGNVLHGPDSFRDQSLFLNNVGTDTLTVETLEVAPLDTFDIVSVFVSIAEQTTIPPGESAEVIVRFTAPDTLGEYEGILTVFSNDPDAPDTTVSLRGNSVETALGIEPDFLDFGDVLLGASKSDSLWLFNISTGDTVWVDSLLVGEPEYTVSLGVSLPDTILPGGTLGLEITFEPEVLGEVLDTLRVFYGSTLPEDDVREVPLSGRGVQQNIALSADSLDFGDVPLTLSLDDTLVIYNVGTADLVVDSLVIDNPDFSVVHPVFPDMPDTIKPNDSMGVTLRFEPSALGEAIGTLTVYSDDPDEPSLDVALSGRGTARPAIVINEVLVDGNAGDANGDGVTEPSGDEFVELLNIDSVAIDLSGWEIHDEAGNSFRFPDGFWLSPEEFVVVFGADPNVSQSLGPVFGGLPGLNNGGDSIYLINPVWPDTVARVTYSSDWGVPESFTRFPDGSGADDDPDAFVAHSTVAENWAVFSPGEYVPLLTSIAVSPEGTSIAKGTTAQYTAVGAYTDLSELDITDEVTWASSDEAVATIDTIDTIGLATGHEKGTTDISASWLSQNAVRDTIITGTATLTVTDSLLVSIAVSPMDTSVAKGRTVQYTAIGTYTDTTESDITEAVDWFSSDTNVATLEPTGLASTWEEGTTYITASAEGFGGLIESAEAMLNVGPAVLDSIVVFPVERDSIVLFEGMPEDPLIPGMQQFEAVGIFSDASTDTLTYDVLWASSDPSIADMEGVGLAVADTSGWNVDLFSASRKGGSVEISASMDRPSEGMPDSFITITGSSTLIVAPLGDVNNSFWWYGEPDVGDAIMVESIILHRPPEPEPPEWPSIFQSFAADRNTDFDINILDVVRIVMDIIKRPFGAVPAKLASGVEEAAQVSLSKRVVGADRVIVPVAVSTSVPIAAAQVRLRYDPAVLIPLAPELTDRSAEMRVNYSSSEDGTLTILLSNLTGAVMPAGSGPIVYAAFGIIGEEEVHTGVTLKEILLSDSWGNSIPFSTTDVEVAAISSLPQAYSMSQNYPNPFNLQTVVRYALPEEGRVVIEVFGLTGQKIRTLVDEPRQAGRHMVVWDGKDGGGNEVASGVYLYRMHAGTFVDMKKMLLIK